MDLDSGKVVAATGKITDSTIEFTGLNESLSGGSMRQFKILITLNDYPDTSESTSIGLSLSPDDIGLVDVSTRAPVKVTGSYLTMKGYIIGKTAPTLSITNIGENLFRLNVVNTDENLPLSISQVGVSVSFTLANGQTFNGTICIREANNNGVCGYNGGSTLTVPSSGGKISLVGATMNTYVIPKSSLDLDIYISSDAIYPTGGVTQISIDNMTYVMDNRTLTEQYGTFTASRTSYKK
jgi:hypothetical protein